MSQEISETWYPAVDGSSQSGLSDSYTRPYRNGSDTASFTTSTGRFDTSILEKQTVKPQSKHTRYKLEVDGGEKQWIIYRRYRDFVLLNKKLRKLFPNFVLTLPPKRILLDNFNKDFIRKRQERLEQYVRNVLNHTEMCQSAPVQYFFRLDNPPQPNESLDACQRYCDELEHRVVDLKFKCRDLEDEINGLKNELENSQHTQDEAKGLAVHLQTQFSSQGTELQELNQDVATAKCNELRAREELDKIREEIRAEREYVQAACDIEKQKQELLLKKRQEDLQKKSEEVNEHLSDVVESFSKLPKLNVTYGGESIEVNTGDKMVQQTYDLKKAIESLRQQQNNICKEMIEMHSKEMQELKVELARSDFITKTRTQEAETLRVERKEMQLKYAHDITARDNFIHDLQQQIQEALAKNNSTEQKYFYSLVLGVKLNMAICRYTMEELNQMRPENLYHRVRANGIATENWPSWVSRELVSYPNPF